VGLWRQNVAEVGLKLAAKIVSDAGLRVSTLCRGGFFTTPDAAEHASAIADNRRAIDEAVALGTRTLVLVPGGVVRAKQDIADGRRRAAASIAEIAWYAQDAGVKLAIEPMNPIFAADRGVVSTLDEALLIAEEVGNPAVGVVVDTYHVWWDPELLGAVHRLGDAGRLVSYQVADWALPLHAEPLNSRGYMGDGYINFEPVTRGVAATGYEGDIEVELFNDDIWAQPAAEAIATVKERFTQYVSPYV
jgi:sugar phosphate isomerase/epimerase